MIEDKRLIEDIIGEALGGTSRPGVYADVFCEWREPTAVILEDGKVEKALAGSERGLCLRLIRDGRTALAVSAAPDPGGLIRMARSLSQALGSDSREAMGPVVLGQPRTARGKFQSGGLDGLIARLVEGDRAARAMGADVTQVSVVYRSLRQRVIAASSLGAFTEEHRCYTTAALSVVAARGGMIQTGYEALGGMAGVEILDEDGGYEALAGKAGGRAIALLGARRAPGGRMPVVISSEAGGTMIHEAIGHGLEADLAGQGLSAFAGKIGQPVASRLVTVIDDATLAGKRGSYAYDDEGTQSERTVLVWDGVLLCYMSDQLSAIKYGGRSTGNGRRESFRHKPITRMSNTFIAPGGSDPGEVLATTERGLFVTRMGGGQVNTVTGEFVFDVQEGYLIEGGRRGELVRGATLTGSGPEVLMAIDMVASDLGFSIGTCGKDGQGVPVSDAMPTLRIGEMVVGGAV